MTATRFAGTIAEKSSLNYVGEKSLAVINCWVEKTQEIIPGIKEKVRARIVAFGNMAEELDDEVSEGKLVMFSNCQRNPRIYVTDRGTEVETVDIVARAYTVLNKTQYEKAQDQIEALSFKAEDLTFTEADRKKAEKQITVEE